MPKKKSQLTEEEKLEKRREYMRKYYRRKAFQMDESGNFIKTPPLKRKVPPLKITHKEVIISFD